MSSSNWIPEFQANKKLGIKSVNLSSSKDFTDGYNRVKLRPLTTLAGVTNQSRVHRHPSRLLTRCATPPYLGAGELEKPNVCHYTTPWPYASF